MEWIGLDIGGANIKIATPDDQFSYPFELWKYPEQLSGFLRQVVAISEDVWAAVTMTGELADGYPTRQAGVLEIIESVDEVFPNAWYYQTTGRFVKADAAGVCWLATAAANWHATASYFADQLKIDEGFLVDIGSTTTDVIPVKSRVPAGSAKTDLERLLAGQLVYTGIRRSPLCGIVNEVNLGQRRLPVANELFATIEDAYVVLGKLPERKTLDTPDGRELTVANSAQRIARMVCTDVEEIGMPAVESLAEQVSIVQRDSILKAVEQVLADYPELPREFLICGEGEWLGCEVLSELGIDQVRRLSNLDSSGVTDCAAAVAVRELAERDVACASSR